MSIAHIVSKNWNVDAAASLQRNRFTGRQDKEKRYLNRRALNPLFKLVYSLNCHRRAIARFPAD
jgi:hypothetical protein